MPAVFSHLPMGGLFAVAFYGCLFVAALTSAISILEMVSQHCVDRWGFTRRTAVLTVSTVLGIIGVFCALSFGPLSDWKLFGRTLLICSTTPHPISACRSAVSASVWWPPG